MHMYIRTISVHLHIVAFFNKYPLANRTKAAGACWVLPVVCTTDQPPTRLLAQNCFVYPQPGFIWKKRKSVTFDLSKYAQDYKGN